MKLSAARSTAWGVVATVALLLAGIGVFVASQIDSAIDTATLMARPHEAQTALEHAKATLDALQDSVQDFLIDGADGMRYQYEDAVRSLGSQSAELASLNGTAMSRGDLESIERQIKEVLATSRAVIDARNTGRPETVRQLSDAGRAAFNSAQRDLDALIRDQQELS